MNAQPVFDRQFCKCPSCGWESRHRKGFPCFRETCEKCGHAMERHMPEQSSAMDSGDVNAEQPVVVRAACIACGVCFDYCPVDAIHFREGKAWIDPQQCLACLICIDHCPQNAIRQERDV